jgi:hypothetical protein
MRKSTQQQTVQRTHVSQHPSNSSSGGWSSDVLDQQAQDRQGVRVQSRQFSQERSGARRDRSSGVRRAAVLAGAGGADRST